MRNKTCLVAAVFAFASLVTGCTSVGICQMNPADPECCAACQRDVTRPWCGASADNAGTCAQPTCDCGAMPDAGPHDGSVVDGGPCGACSTDRPMCGLDNVSCVECRTGTDCDEPTEICDASGTCVECVGHADCSEPGLGRCLDGACAPCGDDLHCVGVNGAGLCEAGTCVQCTVTRETPCAGNSCDPATRTCTTTPTGMTDTCGACVADSECMADHACVRMNFDGAAHGNYCMKRVSAGCARPFLTAIAARPSVSGAVATDYCGIDESTVSCEAVRALIDGDGCAVPGDCDAEGALCATVGLAPDRCTYACGISDQCPSGVSCGSGHCGG